MKLHLIIHTTLEGPNKEFQGFDLTSFRGIELRKCKANIFLGKFDLLVDFLSSISTNQFASKPQNSLIAPPSMYKGLYFAYCMERIVWNVTIDLWLCYD